MNMKKFGIFCLAAVFALIGMSSCQETNEKQDKVLASKIENNEELTSEDYGQMIAYVGEYAEKAQKYVDMQINGDNAEATQGMNTLAEEYPYVETFRSCIAATPLNKLSEDNLKEVAKYVQYTEFSAPSGYTIETNPEAAGMEVAAPDSTDGVIAGAVDTLEIKR